MIFGSPQILLILFVIGGFVYLLISRAKSNRSFDEYRHALSNLEASPGDTELTKLAYDAGRRYSNTTRNKDGIATFSAQDIRNDIEKITPSSRNVLGNDPNEFEQRLAKLEALRDKGTITEDEYSKQREQIVSEL